MFTHADVWPLHGLRRGLVLPGTTVTEDFDFMVFYVCYVFPPF